MRLRIVYRSYGGENMKNRPAYYSKTLALQSFLRAAEATHAEIVFLNDGPMPESRLELMRPVGDVVTLPGVGMRGSYLTALRLPERLGWGADDLVWFSEDDYLYTPEALMRLREVADHHDADYLALYGGTRERPVNVADHEATWQPRGWNPGSPVRIGDQGWVRSLSTTSSFATRVRTLHDDMSIFVQTLLPHRTMLRDHDLCVVYQGYEPHDWRRLGLDLLGRADGDLTTRLREVALAPFKAALNVRSHRLPANRRVLLCATPNLATHLESEWMAPGRDWQRIAHETEEWAAERSTEAAC